MEFIIELVLTVFGDVLAGFVASALDGRATTRSQRFTRMLGYFVLGACGAALSMLIYAEPLLSSATAQRAWLFISPLAAALAAFVYGWIFDPRERRGWTMVHAAVLAGSFTACRFLLLQST